MWILIYIFTGLHQVHQWLIQFVFIKVGLAVTGQPPSQIPACGVAAQGSSERSRSGVNKVGFNCRCYHSHSHRPLMLIESELSIVSLIRNTMVILACWRRRRGAWREL